MSEARISTQGVILGAALFLATIYPGHLLLWMPVFALWALHRPLLKFIPEDILLIGFVVGVAVLTFLGFMPWLAGDRPWNPSPLGYALLIPCVLIGRWIDASTIRWLLAFICFEALVCTIQIAMGQPYVFAGQREAVLAAGETQWGASDLLYFNRAYGLSTNSSVAAQKFMLGVLMLFHVPMHRRWILLAMLLLGAGLYTTFNRSALIAVAFFLSLKGAGVFLRTYRKRQLQVMVILALVSALFVVKWPQIKEQFLRGNLERSVVQESGRMGLVAAAAENIAAHPLVGNYAQRFEVLEYGSWLHLHNSWLQLLADHGIIGGLLIAHSLSLIRPRNLPAFLTLALYSVVQFGLFGKISLINIMFYQFMLQWRPSSRSILSPSSNHSSLDPSFSSLPRPST